MNMTNINVQLLTIEAARTRKKEHIYQAAMLDPHTGSELDVDTIRKMVDDLIVAHGITCPATAKQACIKRANPPLLLVGWLLVYACVTPWVPLVAPVFPVPFPALRRASFARPAPEPGSRVLPPRLPCQ